MIDSEQIKDTSLSLVLGTVPTVHIGLYKDKQKAHFYTVPMKYLNAFVLLFLCFFVSLLPVLIFII